MYAVGGNLLVKFKSMYFAPRAVIRGTNLHSRMPTKSRDFADTSKIEDFAVQRIKDSLAQKIAKQFSRADVHNY